MCSFIIGKREFIKAAGLMCGYEEAKRDSHKWFIDNVRKEFEHAYALNVASVVERCESTDVPGLIDEKTDDLDDVFEAYRKMGALICGDGYTMGVICTKQEGVMDKQEFRLSMLSFFDSVLYQIENDAAHRAVAELFFTCLSKLYESDIELTVDGWWGEVELAA